MIDNIKIKLNNFQGNFENPYIIKQKSTEKYIVYYLLNPRFDPNLDKCKKEECPGTSNCEVIEKCLSFLRLTYNIKTNFLLISNSLRKWYLGGSSLVDLSQDTFYKAIHLIADSLNIDINTILESNFTNSEIGLNIRIDFPVSSITSKIVRYSSFRRDSYGMETVNFIGSERSVKIYDKLNELKAKQKVSQNFYLALEKNNYFFLRIEVRMEDKQSFLNLKLNKFTTIEGLYLNYNDLYLFWAKEVSKIIVFNQIICDSSMSFDDYLLAVALNHEGYLNVLNQCQLRTKNPQKKSEQIKQINKIIKNHSNKKGYNTVSFRKSILINLKRILKENTKINFQDIEEILAPNRLIKKLKSTE